MGIFKETLNSYLRKQLEARQKVIATHKNRSLTPAFHAYTTNKYCNIRMSSGVDITDDQLLELTGEGTKIGNVVLENDLRGYGLAKNYILQGGTLLNPKGAKTPTMRRGFPGKGRPLGGAYGDPLMRGNAKDGYGIVPMPGITDFSVRTKSAYGSLREGKVDFVCHNLRQLAVLEILYMRPGYPVLMEWCWDPYLDNKGKIVKGVDIDKHFISNNIDFFKGDLSQLYISAEITRQRELSFGNYDALLGLCKNFSYSARPDGGFNCTTELMAVGESLTSLKGKDKTLKDITEFVVDEDNTSSIITKDVKIPQILDFLQKTHDFVYQSGDENHEDDESRTSTTEGSDNKLGDDNDVITVGRNFNKSAAYHGKKERRGNMWITFMKDRLNTYNIPYEEVKNKYMEEYIKTKNEPNNIYKRQHTMHFTEGRSKWKDAVRFALVAGTAAMTGGLSIIVNSWLNAEDANAVTEGYIRLDALCYIINKYSMNHNAKDPDQRLNCLQTLNYNPTLGGSKNALRMNTYKKYSKDLGNIVVNQTGHAWASNIVDMSTDPYVCLMPAQLKDKHQSYGNSPSYLRPIENAFGFPDGPNGEDFNTQYVRCFGDGNGTDTVLQQSVLRESYESIGHIMVNLRFALKCHESMFEQGKENPNYSLGSFMAKVLDGINAVMGNGLKLSMVTDNQFPNITQIVDLNQAPKTDYKDIFVFNVLGNDSIVRNFSFNSAIPSAMASTIAIGAGDPDNVSDLDAVTFAAMNRGIRNRIYQPSGFNKKIPTEEEKAELKQKYNDEMLEIIKLGTNIADYQVIVQTGQLFHNTEQAKNEIAIAKSNLTRMQTLINVVSTKDEEGNQNIKINPPASTPIPIKIDMTLDGIGGLVIGQLFRVKEDRLPLQYRNKRIIFVVVSEEQKIDSNGNWTTKISGQMQLFPDPTKQKPQTKASLELANFNPRPYCVRLAEALHAIDDDEATVERILLNSGFTDLEIRKIQHYFNTGGPGNKTEFTDTFTRSMPLHEWIEDDYVDSSNKKKARKMFKKMGQNPFGSLLD